MAILGVSGRMGRSLVRCLDEPEASSLVLTGAVAGAASARLGEDAAPEGRPSGVTVTSDLDVGLRGARIALDFSRPESVAAHASACAQAQVALLVGTTGLDAGAHTALAEASRRIAVLIAPNTSTGVGVLAELVRLATVNLGPSYDVEITEVHHRLKRDAPSGTALALGAVVANARGSALADLAVYARHGGDALRTPGSIGFSVIRAGDVIGEHSVVFAGAGERVEIIHRATDRAAFARGALRAAIWLAERPAGLYRMENVFGSR